MVRSPLVVKWAGNDVDPRVGRNGRDLAWLAGHIDLCLVASGFALNAWRDVAPLQTSKFEFWPTAIDVQYYADRGSLASTSRFYVAVGSDSRRDWNLPIDLAEMGYPIVILTADPRVLNLIEERRSTVRVHYDIGFEASAEILGECAGIFLATLPNDRFSGSTTVGVAAALKKPLILDEKNDLDYYGLLPNENCLVFERGDLRSAADAIDRLEAVAGLKTKISAGIGQLASNFSIDKYADRLEKFLSTSSGSNVRGTDRVK